MNMLAVAISFASRVHEGQVDKGGRPYILHPMRVMMGVKDAGDEVMCMAILHDVVEDCGVSVGDLREIGMSERVLEGLECLTHGDDETYESYIDRVLTNRDAMLVKREDLRDNSDLTRLRGIGGKDIERMGRYMVAWKRIEDGLRGGVVESNPASIPKHIQEDIDEWYGVECEVCGGRGVKSLGDGEYECLHCGEQWGG